MAHSRGQQAPRGDGRVPGGRARRGDRRRRATDRSGPSSPWRATRCCPRPNSDATRRRARRARVHGAASTSTSTRRPATPTSSCRRPSPLQTSPLRPRRSCSSAIRNVANYSRAVLPLDDGQPDEWEIIAKLDARRRRAMGADADPAIVDDTMIAGSSSSAVGDRLEPSTAATPTSCSPSSRHGRRGPERMLDSMLRTGPFGDAFGADPDGLIARRAARATRTASTSAPLAAPPARGAAHADRADRAGAGADRRRRRPAARPRSTRSTRRRAGARRSPRPAVEQLAGCTTSRCS